jgi:Skp family chaperone for outer membrane proteins
MKNLMIGAAVALTLAVPGAALAQRNAPAAPTVLIVDTERVFTECNACRVAATTLQQQAAQYNQRAQQLQGTLSDGAALETAVRALNGRAPDAALQQRITAFQQRERSATVELENRQQALRSTQAHIQQQIGTRLVPIVEQIRAARGATIVMARNAALAHNPAMDVSNEVLAQLNASLTTINVTPLPQAQQPAGQPQPTPQPGR